jgi:hypothetical protein
MELHEIHLPSVADYVAAFQATEARITPKQRELLLVHHRAQARVTSATRLAEAVGFENYNAVNLQYGLLARQIADQLGIELSESVVAGVLVEFVDPGFAANEHFPWVLRPNVAQALEELGWAPPVSHLLYPAFALTTHPETFA